MRAALALLLFVAGTATAGAAFMRSNERVQADSRWSISERLAALRIERALSPSVHVQATLAFEDSNALLRVRDASGAVLLRCPKSADLAEALRRRSLGLIDPFCDAQSLDDSGDVLIYEVGGRIPPLCPDAHSSLSEEQLEHALFLPALQEASVSGAVLQRGKTRLCNEGEANCALFRSAGSLLYCGVVKSCAEGACFQGASREIQPDDVATSLYYTQARVQSLGHQSIAPSSCGAVPTSARVHLLISEAITATSAHAFAQAQPQANAFTKESSSAAVQSGAEIERFFTRNPRGICFQIDGVDLERKEDAAAVAQALAFPVFAPEDPRAPGRATPFLRSLQDAAGDADLVAAMLPRCDLSAESCRKLRERIAAQLRASLGKLQPALTTLADDELPLHLGASGPFHLTELDPLHAVFESAPLHAKDDAHRLRLRFQPLWPELLAERRRTCEERPGTCLFRSAWSLNSPPDAEHSGEPKSDEFDSLLGLFVRGSGEKLACVRKLFNAIAAADSKALEALQQDLHDPAENHSSITSLPCDPRSRTAVGLIPRDREGSCQPRVDQPFGDVSKASCAPLSLVYAEEEPWGKAASRIAAIALGAGVPLVVSSARLASLRNRSANFDLALTVANNVYDPRFPTLVPLLAGEAQSDSSESASPTDREGASLLQAYESSLVYPAPDALATGPAAARAAADRLARLQRLEDYTARKGRSPIFPLAFLRAQNQAVPRSQALASESPWYLAGLPEGWSKQP